VSVVVIEIVIIRAREALQVRGRVSPSVDTNDRRGGDGVSGGYEASIAVIQAEVQVVLQQRSCARVRVGQEGTALGFARRLSLGHVKVIMFVLGEVQDDRGSVPSGGNPTRERVRTTIVRGHVSVFVIEKVIIRAREALQVRGRISPSVDTNDRRGGGGVLGGYEASIAVIQADVQVVLQQRSRARVRVEQEGAVLGFARRLSLGHVKVIMFVLGEVQDDRGSVPSGGNPTRERVRARHDIGTRVGNGGRSIRGALVQGLCGSC
jgi:hypothetical protein